MKKIINAFSVPFLEAKMDDIDNDDLLRKINLMFDSTPIKRTLSQHWFDNVETNSFPLEGYSSFNDPNGDLIKRNEFNFFYQRIGVLIRDFFNQLGYTGPWKYVNSWAAIYPNGAFVPRHNHGDVHWSGVYYVNASNNCGDILFDDPKEYSLTNEPEGFMHRGAGGQRFRPESGKLLLWPGYVKHFSLPNNTNIQRTIISFNINCTSN